jgi:hypothetical protein
MGGIESTSRKKKSQRIFVSLVTRDISRMLHESSREFQKRFGSFASGKEEACIRKGFTNESASLIIP